MDTREQADARFWGKVEKGDGCWLWLGCLTRQGYGNVKRGGKNLCAHRVAWEMANGSAGDMFVCHRCDNPRCVRPGHLFLGTQQDNMADMIAKDRHSRGGRGRKTTLTESDVIDIRTVVASGARQRAVAAGFGISTSSVGLIVHRKRWAHVP